MVRTGFGLLELQHFLCKGDFFVFSKLANAFEICFIPVAMGDVLGSRHPLKVGGSLISEALWFLFSHAKLFYFFELVLHWDHIVIKSKRLIFPCTCNLEHS